MRHLKNVKQRKFGVKDLKLLSENDIIDSRSGKRATRSEEEAHDATSPCDGAIVPAAQGPASARGDVDS